MTSITDALNGLIQDGFVLQSAITDNILYVDSTEDSKYPNIRIHFEVDLWNRILAFSITYLRMAPYQYKPFLDIRNIEI